MKSYISATHVGLIGVIILLLAAFTIPTSAQQTPTITQDSAQQKVVHASPTGNSITNIYWSGKLQDARVIQTSDGDVILPGENDIVNLIILFKSPSLATHKQQLQTNRSLSTLQRATLLEAQRKQIVTEQQAVLENMKAQGWLAAQSYQYSYLLNAVAVSAPMGRIQEITQLPGVQSVAFDYQAQIQLHESVPLIGAPQVWAQLDGANRSIRGQGMHVAILDTGIDYTHPDLGGCFGPGCRVVDGYDFFNDDPDPIDDNAHGTHVAGIVASNGQVQGVAPEVTLLAYKVCDQYGGCQNSDIIAGLERAANPDQDLLTEDAVDVINMSLASPGAPDDPLSIATNHAVAQGIVVVVSAGDVGKIGSPGAAADAITVGASTKSDHIAEFGAIGWVGEFSSKPDLVAPGLEIYTPALNGSYQIMSGTSMAAPHVAGAAALLRQAHPDWTPLMVKLSLMNSALDLGKNPFIQGAGRVRLNEALDPTLFAAPGSLSFGAVDLTMSTWHKTLSLTISNPTSEVQQYQLAIAPGLPDGLSLSLDQTEISLNSGQSALVNVTLTVSNDVLPFPENDQFVYHGTILINQGTVQKRVPVSVVKAAILELHSSGDVWPVTLRDGTQSIFIDLLRQTSVLVPVKPGKYDLISGYGFMGSYPYAVRFAVKEGIDVITKTAVTLQTSDAPNKVITTFQDVDNQIKTLDTRTIVLLRHKHVDWQWAITDISFSPEIYFSNVSSNYYVELCGDYRLYPAKQAVYNLCYEMENGIDSAQTLQLDVDDLRPLTYTFEAESQTTTAFPLLVYYYSPLFVASGSFFESDWMSPPFARTYYHTLSTSPYAMKYGVYLYGRSGAGEPQLIFQSPMLSIGKQAIKAEYWNTGFPQQYFESYETQTSTWNLGQSPIYWAGRFDNQPDRVYVRPNTIWYNYLRDQFQNDYVQAVNYTITHASGVSYGQLIPGEFLPVTPGSVKMEMEYVFPSNGNHAIGQVTAQFNTDQADKNPPSLRSIMLSGPNGDHINKLAGESELQVGILDDTQVAKVILALDWNDGQGWQDLTVVQSGDVYKATIPTYKGDGTVPVALKVEAIDGSDNLLRNVISPAFLAEATQEPIAKVASITLSKEALPDSPRNFHYYGPWNDFYLDDPGEDDGDTIKNSMRYNEVTTPGTYSISEEKIANWFLDNIVCTPSATVNIDKLQRSVTLHPQADEQIVCNFINKYASSLSVYSYWDIDQDGQHDPTEDWQDGWWTEFYDSSGTLKASNFTQNGGHWDLYNIRPGTYTVCQKPQDGWYNTKPILTAPTHNNWPCYTFDLSYAQRAKLYFGYSDQPFVGSANPESALDGVQIVTVTDPEQDALATWEEFLAVHPGDRLPDEDEGKNNLFLPMLVR